MRPTRSRPTSRSANSAATPLPAYSCATGSAPRPGFVSPRPWYTTIPPPRLWRRPCTAASCHEARASRALARLRQLEADLSELPADPGLRQPVGARLDVVARAWRRTEPPGDGGAAELNLDIESHENLFGLIDSTFGATEP